MKFSTFSIFLSSVVVPGCSGKNVKIEFDCSNPRLEDICKGDCWGAYCLRQGTEFTKVGQEEAQANRKFTNGAPGASQQCGEGGIWIGDPPNPNRNTIEEYPFASTNKGGQSAALRCAARSGQSGESRISDDMSLHLRVRITVQGGKLGSSAKPGDTYSVEFINFENLVVDWCNPANGGSSTCQNDDGQFYFDGSQFVPDTRGKPVSKKTARRLMAATEAASNVTDAPRTVINGGHSYGSEADAKAIR
ncbi:MAG: hypothetical protein M1821_005778 [Bathelium mastoideum]|nr:MAG: hypothetical protein M1821_005778 [Bathelium mastoideum]